MEEQQLMDGVTGKSREAGSGAMQTAQKIVGACADAKGKDITVLNVSKIFDLADCFVIVSGRSDRQVQGIANKIVEKLGEAGMRPLAVEGLEKGHWVLMDFGDVVAHVFYEPMRRHYDLEGLWIRAEKLLYNERSGALARERRAA